jgi:hypothetical protein
METVGRFGPPYFAADWIDQWLWDVAGMIGRRKFLPGVKLIHHHPAIEPETWDQTHTERSARGVAQGPDELYRSDAMVAERQAEAVLLGLAIAGWGN